MINQGSSELNIIVGVPTEQYEHAIQAIYAAFADKEQCHMVLQWEEIKCESMTKGFFGAGMMPLFRAKVPGGWFIQVSKNLEASAFFYPDPEHTWDGSSLP